MFELIAFWRYKESSNNVRCTIEVEKLKKCCERNHTLLFFRLRETAQEYLFRGYQSLHS